MHPQIQPTEGQLYVLFYAILYEGLEHPQIWVSTGGVLEPVADGYQGIAVVKFLGVESYTWIFDCTGVGAPNPCAVPGSAVYGILKVELKELLME